MLASELFETIRAAFGLEPRIRDDGRVSIAIYPKGLISIAVWVGEGKGRRLHLMYSTEMNMEREIGAEDWVVPVMELCEWQEKRNGQRRG